MEERQLSASERLNPAMSATQRCPMKERQTNGGERPLSSAMSDGRAPDEKGAAL